MMWSEIVVIVTSSCCNTWTAAKCIPSNFGLTKWNEKVFLKLDKPCINYTWFPEALTAVELVFLSVLGRSLGQI